MVEAVVRATSTTHPDHTKLSETDRYHIAVLVWMALWPKQAIADVYGVSRKTVLNCFSRYFGEQVPQDA